MATTVKKVENEEEVQDQPEVVEVQAEEPVIYYSDQPGAGPDDEEEAAPKKKAVASPPQNKAVTQKSEQTK